MFQVRPSALGELFGTTTSSTLKQHPQGDVNARLILVLTELKEPLNPIGLCLFECCPRFPANLPLFDAGVTVKVTVERDDLFIPILSVSGQSGAAYKTRLCDISMFLGLGT
jgi:hypothetical protein